MKETSKDKDRKSSVAEVRWESLWQRKEDDFMQISLHINIKSRFTIELSGEIESKVDI